MITVLLVFLLFAVLQVAVLFYVRSVTASAAADGARYAANADVGTAAGAGRAGQLIRHGLGASMANQLPCMAETNRDAATGLAVAQVSCRGRIRSLLMPLGAFVSIDVTARSLKDGR
jgi:Flp pilus assembly protein TadG